MKRLLWVVLATATFAACDKSGPASGSPGITASNLVGKWMLSETRADPGDGSGRWRSVDQGINIIIEFKADGSFKSTEANNLFNRYEINGDSARLYHIISRASMQIAIQELNALTFSYYYGWPWCGGPTGRKFVRL